MAMCVEEDKYFLMNILLMRFEIPKNKLYEFDLALGRLVKWPVYTLHTTASDSQKKTFEFIRSWDSEEEMQKDLKSQIFVNLMGVVKVLGHVHQSQIYHVAEQRDLLQEQE